jgi:hypothetical protein
VRLLLDEMYPATIAEGLRERGHDAVAVVERPELRNVPDDELFALAQAEQRVVVTENVRDFVPIVNDHDLRGDAHHGVVLVNPRRYVRGSPRTVGAMVRALDVLAGTLSSARPTSVRHWL